ncbi:hypothetical protein DdX_18889 [Ditylenchus destructor]|uniref:Uncharacterized protein n=1 Tax=Ditylenchus destructor TaxID=166010 RepID=A0AAD4MIU0_9BILA|nr:hypothetical protein DdX_18889 [Ditylenchus destructor]
MPKSPINKKTIKADIGYDFDSKCHKPLDNETSFILRQFHLGYKTMWAEDWATFNWPNCTGFKDAPVDHFFKPFIQRIDFMTLDFLRKTNRFKNNPYTNYMQDLCREIHEMILEYLESFHNYTTMT